jgi:Pentapeptide repeats (8 copies)
MAAGKAQRGPPVNEFSKSAVASLILAAIAAASLALAWATSATDASLLSYTSVWGSIFAIVLGIVAKRRRKAWQGGDGMATVGLVLGIVVVVLTPVLSATTDVFRNRCDAIEPGADLAGCNLSDKDLSGEDLSNANLAGAKLTGADLTGADLHGSQGLESARLQDVRGLDDKALAAALEVSEVELPTYLASHGRRLESAALIGQGFAGVCDGNPLADAAEAPNGTLAVVDATASKPTARDFFWIPAAWEPMARRFVYRVACVSDESRVVDKCLYTGGVRKVVRQSYSIVIRDARTGKRLASKTVTGREPTCPSTIPSTQGEIYGPQPKRKMNGWLERWRN